MRSIGVNADWSNDVLRSANPVLVKFTSASCRPCKQLQPVLDDLAIEFSGRVEFLLADLDTCPDAFDVAGVSTVPALLLFRGGQEVAQRIGGGSRPALEAWLVERLGKEPA